jgi:hypothetical protein
MLQEVLISSVLIAKAGASLFKQCAVDQKVRVLFDFKEKGARYASSSLVSGNAADFFASVITYPWKNAGRARPAPMGRKICFRV